MQGEQLVSQLQKLGIHLYEFLHEIAAEVSWEMLFIAGCVRAVPWQASTAYLHGVETVPVPGRSLGNNRPATPRGNEIQKVVAGVGRRQPITNRRRPSPRWRSAISGLRPPDRDRQIAGLSAIDRHGIE